MDPRLPRLRRKLARIPFNPLRSHSFGEEHHQFRLGPRLSESRAAAFETEHGIELPDAYRNFLTGNGATGAAPFYGLLPLGKCTLFTMAPKAEADGPRRFTAAARRARRGDLFLNIIEAGCSDLVLLGVSGPLAGRILTGNADGFWGPDLSPFSDFIAWYEHWLDDMAEGRDNRALELTAPAAEPAQGVNTP